MTQLNKCSLLEKLISRGDHIEIINGRLTITPASKLDIPIANREQLIIDITNLLGVGVYIFDGYSTGHYGKHKSPGVTLQFVSIATGEQSYVTFNAELKRSRTTAQGKKGASLPKGQFRIGKKYKFYSFWCSTGLKLPPRLSAFHDYMGNLKQLYFVPSVDNNSKVLDKMIPTLNVEHSDILKLLLNNATYNYQTSDTQQPDNKHTRMPNKSFDTTYINKEIQSNTTTCSNNYELSKQGSAVTSNTLLDINNKRPEKQTTDEWLNDWEQA